MAAAPARPTIRPSGWWYVTPVVGLVVGLVLGAMSLVSGFHDAQSASFDAALAGPGETQLLTIEESGSYTVAYIGPLVVFTEGDQARLAQDLDISITPDDGGAPLVLAPYQGLNDLEQDGAQYVPLLTVRFDQPGDYTFASSSAAGLDREQSRLVVLESPWRKLRDGATRGVVTVAVATFLALLVVVILARTRGRAKRAARTAAPGWPPAGGPGGPYPTTGATWGQGPGAPGYGAPGPGAPGGGPPPGGGYGAPPGWPPSGQA